VYLERPFATGLVMLTIMATTLAYSVDFITFNHPKEMALAAGVVLVAGVLLVHGGPEWRALGAFWPLWLIVIFACVVRGWVFPTVSPTVVLESAARWTLMLLAGAMVFTLAREHRARNMMLATVVAAAVAAAGLALAQLAGLLPGMFPEYAHYPQAMYSVFGNEAFLGGFVAVALPLALGIGQRNRWSLRIVTVSILGAALVLSGAQSAWLSGAAGIFVLGITGREGRHRAAAGAATIGFIAIAGLALFPELWGRPVDGLRLDSRSLGLRIWFLDGTASMWGSRPVVGHGLGVFPYRSALFLGQALLENSGGGHEFNEVHTYHAHNDLLELGAEGGVVAVGLMLAFSAKFLRSFRCVETSALVALAVFSCFNPGFHGTAHALIALVLVGSILGRRQLPGTPSRIAGMLVTGMAIAITAFLAWSSWFPSHAHRFARDIYLDGGDALPIYAYLSDHPWPNAFVQQDYGIALMSAGMYDEAVNAFERSGEIGLISGDTYLGLSLSYIYMGESEPAEVWARRCLGVWPANVHAWSVVYATASRDEWAALAPERTRWLDDEQEQLAVDQGKSLRVEFDP